MDKQRRPADKTAGNTHEDSEISRSSHLSYNLEAVGCILLSSPDATILPVALSVTYKTGMGAHEHRRPADDIT